MDVDAECHGPGPCCITARRRPEGDATVAWPKGAAVRNALALLLLARAAAAQGELQIPFEKYTLENGLEVILHEDHRLPLVAVNLWYHVGAYHEMQGRTGFAHLFEHMLFQGSKNVGDDMHFKILEDLGASEINGTTDFDRTNYFATIPRHHLETGLWLESDRMGFLLDALTQAKLDNQREVVKNERRQSVETAPYGLAEEKLWQALFPAPHPYFGVVIGSMEDLGKASLDDVKNFFRDWYAPSNATLVLAGDYDPAQAKALVTKYFGSLPTRARPTDPKVAPVALDKELVVQHEETIATLPKLFVAWHSPAVYKPGDDVADVLSQVLTEGKASRLQKRLVHEKQIAQSVAAYQQSLGAQSIFAVEAVARPGVTTADLLNEVDAVLDEVRAGKVTPEEVKRAANRLETKLTLGLQRLGGFGGKADQLQRYNHFLNDPGWLSNDLARYQKVNVEAITAFAKETLAPQKRVVVHAVPKPAESAAATAAPAATAKEAK
jgi:predicted Zn-dependent peptidase